jgi:hypothetical protein
MMLVSAILTHLGLPADVPRARGRDPTIVLDELRGAWASAVREEELSD